MTSAAVADDFSASWDSAVAELLAEAAFLSRHLQQPLARTPGVAGILSRLSPSTLWVYDDIEVDELLREIEGVHPAPEVLVPEHFVGTIAAMEDRGWFAASSMERLRHDLGTGDLVPPPTALLIRRATLADLPALRALHSWAFESDHSADYLPDEMLSVPGLCMFAAASSLHPDQFVGVAGIRLRHEGAFVFALATAPHVQRRGIGTALVRTCLAWAADRGAPFAIADVDVPAPALWEHLGFGSTGRWRRFAPVKGSTRR